MPNQTARRSLILAGAVFGAFLTLAGCPNGQAPATGDDPNVGTDPNGVLDPNDVLDPNEVDPNDPNDLTDPNDALDPNEVDPNDPNAALDPNDPNDLTDPNDVLDPNTLDPNDAIEIWSNDNILAVFNNPAEPTEFTTSETYFVTWIRNYHWNNGQGTASPGTITLRDAAGDEIATWQCTGAEGQGGVPNAYWICRPNIELPAGTYTIEDSDPTTRANNPDSGDAGISIVRGFPLD